MEESQSLPARIQQSTPAVSVGRQGNLKRSPVEKGHPRLGRNFHEAAIAFAEKWPIGSDLTTSEVAEWAALNGYLSFNFPLAKPPQRKGEHASIEWKDIQDKTLNFIYGINKAASHDRFWDSGNTAFQISNDKRKRNGWEVRSIPEMIRRWDHVDRAISYVETLHKKQQRLMQGLDWPNEHPGVQLMSEMQLNKESALIKLLKSSLSDFRDEIETLERGILRIEGVARSEAMRLRRQFVGTADDGINPDSDDSETSLD